MNVVTASPTADFHGAAAIHTTWAASRPLLLFLVLQTYQALDKDMVRYSPWAGTHRWNRLDSNKQRKSLLGPGWPLWNEKIHRQKKHFSILLYTHITLQTWWPVSPLGPSPAPAPGSCVCKGEKGNPAHVNWQCISARHDWKRPQQQLPIAASLQIRKKILFSSVLPYRPNWLKEVPKEHLESRSCKSHVRDRKGQTTPCLSRLFRRNNSNCDFDFHSWGAASPLQAGAQPVCNWTM